MDRVRGGGGGDGGEGLGLSLQRGAAAALDLVGAVGQAAEEGADLRPDRGRAAQAGVGGDLVAYPVPDALTVANLMHGLSVDRHNKWSPDRRANRRRMNPRPRRG